MLYRVTNISVHQTALMLAVAYALLAVVAFPFLLFAGIVSGDWVMVVLALLAPFLYGVATYVFTAIGLLVYNLLAGRLGGVEATLEPAPAAGAPPSATAPAAP